jgi:uncharacterized protein (TIGR01777 family)
MRVLLTGATGFIGTALVQRLYEEGHDCCVLSQRPERAGTLLPAAVTVLTYHDRWPVVDAVVNLAGASVAGLWTPQRRRAIKRSRTEITHRLVEWMRVVSPRPAIFVSMSAVGIYGDRPGELLDEESAPDPARRFRADVTLAWETQADRAQSLGVRVARVRMGNVLHPDGGYLATLLKIYRRLPLVVVPGDGANNLAWISHRDAVRFLRFVLEHERAAGSLNAVAPQPVTQQLFAEQVARRLGKPVWGHIPDRVLALLLGEFSTVVLDDQQVVPARAEALGFRYKDPDLGPYLEHIL